MHVVLPPVFRAPLLAPMAAEVYIATAIRKPGGPGPSPMLVCFHGAPRGRAMEKPAAPARGETAVQLQKENV
jgi:hypothetical protein